mmetsp:Transcript_9075/g.17898  ORF Transcript_9075/g.17898 Transcript_9075/m.17898 type:complete len:112 (-) Transcript_9075:166-501(-)
MTHSEVFQTRVFHVNQSVQNRRGRRGPLTQGEERKAISASKASAERAWFVNASISGVAALERSTSCRERENAPGLNDRHHTTPMRPPVRDRSCDPRKTQKSAQRKAQRHRF